MDKEGAKLLVDCLIQLYLKKEENLDKKLSYKDLRSWRRKSNKRKRTREKQEESRSLIRQIIKYEKSKPCADCGRNLFGHMTFDHLPEFKKKDTPCGARSFSVLFNELKKCQIVCCICHHIRELTRNRPSGHRCKMAGCQYSKIRKFLFKCYQSAFNNTQRVSNESLIQL